MFGLFNFLVALFACVGYAHGSIAWKATPFNPPSVPLAVRSPYSSAWLPQNAGSGSALSNTWPQFWNGDTLGWAGFVKVDGVSYIFWELLQWQRLRTNKLRRPACRVFVLTAGPIQLTVTFLSPVEPTSLVNQSIPFSYMSVYATPTDANSHSVQVYSDISSEWVSGTDSQKVNWTTTTGDVIIHQVQLENQTLFTDSGDRVQYGAVYYASQSSSSTTWQTGQDLVLRAQFINNGTLLNTQDTNFRAINNDWPCFAFAHDLGNITGQSDTVVFVVGHARDPAISYVATGGTMQSRSSLYLSQFSSTNDAITTFVEDYSNALSRANILDAEINKDTTAISSNYTDIVALSVRQTFGAMEFTYTPGNASDVMVFVKEISSSDSVSTTDLLFSAWPLFLYTNAAIGKAALLPLLEYQATGQYPNKWACHDLGPAYPKAPGYPKGNDTRMPVEEDGNMLIMALSYTQKTNDKSLITTYYSLLDQWAQYLVSNTLEPTNQLSSDAFAGSLTNQTDLALKGIIGIKAMAEIASLLGNSSANSNYNSIASSYVQKWQQMATTSDGIHLTLQYGNSSSWGISYNMYADKLLGTNIVPSSVYEMQTEWYTSVENTYGVPLDTRNTYVLSNWEIWAAATMTTTSAQNQLINYVHKYLSSSLNSVPASDWARPVVGGHLALLVTSASNSTSGTSITAGPTATAASPQSSSTATTSSHSSAMSLDPRTVLSWLCLPALAMTLLSLAL
ncbi:uncharacterized protein B0H18DRAFT_1112408 [Fomitopsis serialis]|uniref:uncharacterized protein n=1 Tax=Fomitopsis serialis TaxID=139415 RepID=UPI002008C214|nr:uncharacterized protein B0H18DRAFT_1112408 [Neoantrodia serialis]KAH9938229.1 hypothetical protein B0H18DRAFT_1112408 [Neoantrodia serialis]